MKIGIVTFWDSKDNYGQLLQAYSLCRYLFTLGHRPYIIRYKYREPRTLKYWLKKPYLLACEIKYFLVAPKKYRETRQLQRMALSHDRKFDAFRSRYIPMSESIYNQHELKKTPPKSDVYMSGSDQIWSRLDPVYYLEFSPDGIPCLAYGPSCGGQVFTPDEKAVLQKYLKRYCFIGLRESRDTELMNELGFNGATTVVDPTMLLSANDYNQVADNRYGTGNYILVYFIGTKYDFDLKDVYHYAEQNQLKVRYVASQGCYDEYEKIYPTVEEWLGLVRGASYVVTNSFHGTVFSLIYHRNFLVIPQTGTSTRMNARLTDLLRPLCLENRIYGGDINVLNHDVDYDKFDKILNYQIQQSKSKFTNKIP